MTIFACGINHKTAPVELREKVIFSTEKLGLYLNDLLANENIREAMLLSTCNRSELYCETDSSEKLLEWFARQHQLSPLELQHAWYCYQDEKAIEHIMRVACGLDSMVLGEPQIAGQMKEAFSESCAASSIGPQFNRLFQQVFSVTKEVRTNTAIGACPVSISSAAVNLAKNIFPKALNEACVLLIGAGDTIHLVLKYLDAYNVKKIIIANRRRETAEILAQKFSAEAIEFAKLSAALSEADIVISATGSVSPIVKKEHFSKRSKPIFIVDIAVPRDVAAEVADLSDVNLYSIDDLKKIIQNNLHGREHAAEKAEEVIQKRSQEYIIWLQSLNQVATTIRAYRKQIEDLCAAELNKALRQLDRGDEPQLVLAHFAHSLTNKLLHNPSIQLRQAGAEGRFELLKLAQQLLAV